MVTQGSRIRLLESSASRRKLREMVEEIHLLLNPTGLEVIHIPSTHIPAVRTSHLSARSAEKCHPYLVATLQLCTKMEDQNKPWRAVSHLCHHHFRIKNLNLREMNSPKAEQFVYGSAEM